MWLFGNCSPTPPFWAVTCLKICNFRVIKRVRLKYVFFIWLFGHCPSEHFLIYPIFPFHPAQCQIKHFIICGQFPSVKWKFHICLSVVIFPQIHDKNGLNFNFSVHRMCFKVHIIEYDVKCTPQLISKVGLSVVQSASYYWRQNVNKCFGSKFI